jgi:hypothetical protein
VLSDNPGAQKLELLYEKTQQVIEVLHAISTKAESSWIAGGWPHPARLPLVSTAIARQDPRK